MATKAGVVNIHGREYQTVALRVANFREAHPEHSLLTEVLHRDSECVLMKASIIDPAGRVISTGHSEEYRDSSSINKTSALENSETSAIGRALAAFGMGGTEFASADEVARAVSGQKQFPSTVKTAMVEISDEAMATLNVMAQALIDLVNEESKGADNEYKIWELVEPLESDHRIYLWDTLVSAPKVRKRIKEVSDKLRAAA